MTNSPNILIACLLGAAQLTELAEVSGHAEIAAAPFLTIGHSGGAIPAWRMGYWKPECCLGVIGLHAAPSPSPCSLRKRRGAGFPGSKLPGVSYRL